MKIFNLLLIGVFITNLISPILAFSAEDESTGPSKSFCEAINDPEENKYFKEIAEGKNWRKVGEKYHKNVNNLFSAQIKKLTAGSSNKAQCADKKTHFSDVAFNSDENSKFIEDVLDETTKIECALFYKILYYNNTVTAGTLTEAFSEHRTSKEEIMEEIDVIEKTIPIALDALSEMQIAFVIHQHLQCVIEALNELKTEFGNFVEQMLRIPGKYINCSFQAR